MKFYLNITCIVVLFIFEILPPQGNCFSPAFSAPVTNITVARGREAKFTCKVRSLGGYRVGWVKADTKAIQAIHTHVITHNPRVHVAYDDHSTWHLILKQVTEEDKGPYMCQINTDPMISQIGYLEVVTPPEIDDVYSTSDVIVTEGSPAILRCVARGNPHPEITWKREDSQGILISDGIVTTSVSYKIGESLELPRVTREHMGAFMCIANNKVPPQVSKRINLEVHFHPIINVPNQLIGSPYGQNVTMQCNVEASPPPVTFWNNDNNEMLSNSSKYYIISDISGYVVKMHLNIIDLAANDIGSYKCIARNSIGKVESVIKVNYIQPPTQPPTQRPPPMPYLPPLDTIIYGPGAGYHPVPSTSSNLPVPMDNDVWMPSDSEDPWSQGPQNSPKAQQETRKSPNHSWIPSFLDSSESSSASLQLGPDRYRRLKMTIISLLVLITHW